MKVRFFERAKSLVRLGCGSLAVLLLATQAQAAQPGWEAQIINISDQQIGDTTAMAAVLDSNGAGYTVTSNAKKVYPLIDFLGTGGANFPYNYAYPDGTTNNAGDDFAVRAKTTVTIPAGTWSVAFGSDDGGTMTMPAAVSFTSTFGENPTDQQGVGTNVINYSAPRGHSWTGGTFTAAGPISGEIIADFYERGGGDSFEVAVAQGSVPGFSSAVFKPLANGVFGWQLSTNSNATNAGQPVIDIAGGNIGTATAPIASGGSTANASNPATAVPGLLHRYYNVGNAGTLSAADAVKNGMAPGAIFQGSTTDPQWWGGSEGAKPGNVPQYQAGLVTAINNGMFTGGGGATNLENYMGLLTGQIFIPAGVNSVNFKDGVDDFTSLRLDLNGDGSFQDATEAFLGDNNSTSYDGTGNSGSPIVTVDTTSAQGKWINFEMMTWEGGGGDAGVLWWDATPAAAAAFPVDQTSAPSDLAAAFVPTANFRNNGGSATANPALDSFVRYDFDVHSKSFSDQITIPGGANITTSPLNLNGAGLKIKGVGDLHDGESIKIISGPSTGTANFTFPAGTEWDTSSLNATGEIKLVKGPNGPGGGYQPDVEPDGDVDSADLAAFLEAWTGALGAGNMEQGDNPDLVYDPATGNVKLVPTEGSAKNKIVGFVLANTSGAFKPEADGNFTGRTPWSDAVYDNLPKQIGSSDLGGVGTAEGQGIDLGNIFPTGLDKQGLFGLLSQADVLWKRGAGGKGALDLVVVPEPASLALLGLGLLGVTNVVRRRRK